MQFQSGILAKELFDLSQQELLQMFRLPQKLDDNKIQRADRKGRFRIELNI